MLNEKFGDLQCLPNVYLMSAQFPIYLPNVPNICPMSFAVKSPISSDMFKKKLFLASKMIKINSTNCGKGACWA